MWEDPNEIATFGGKAVIERATETLAPSLRALPAPWPTGSLISPGSWCLIRRTATRNAASGRDVNALNGLHLIVSAVAFIAHADEIFAKAS
jgi:hypothetical protein